MRSVVFGQDVVGNLAGRQAALASTERGIEAAALWLQQALQTSRTTNPNIFQSTNIPGYFPHVDLNAPQRQPWEDAANWTAANSVLVPDARGQATDVMGNRVRYQIYRQCATTGAATPATCVTSLDTAASGSGTSGSGTSGGCVDGQDCGSNQTGTVAAPPRVVHYLVVVRSDGPRDSSTVVQSLISLPIS
jgi:hypothetical protein